MAYPIFQCAYEKDHNPAISSEAEHYYQKARTLEKAKGIINWSTVIGYYQKAIELDHWKAMNNLAILYQQGRVDSSGEYRAPQGIPQDLNKTLQLFQQMVALNVPLGYYNWGFALEKGWVTDPDDSAAASKFMFHAASLGNPLAQVRLGNFFAFVLPREEQRDDLAEGYFRCAGAQDNKQALLEVAGFYDVAKKNKPRALFYYQKAAALGNSEALSILEEVFNEGDLYQFGYLPDTQQAQLYANLYEQLRANPDLKFPNLLTEHPLPPHPIQGYDANNPQQRPV